MKEQWVLLRKEYRKELLRGQQRQPRTILLFRTAELGMWRQEPPDNSKKDLRNRK
jgi:hypothetical protein